MNTQSSPAKSFTPRLVWPWLLLAFVVVMGATVLSDWLLTRQAPNPLFNLLLWLGVAGYAFHRFACLSWKKALLLAFAGFVGQLLAGAFLVSLAGISTPRS